MLRDAIALRESLPEEPRSRVHLASMPMDDIEENAIMINALQRHARVVAQKSIAEGFGLTVAEAMWKARPVVASRIGGIQDQIVDGETGVLLDDPARPRGLRRRDHRSAGRSAAGGEDRASWRGNACATGSSASAACSTTSPWSRRSSLPRPDFRRVRTTRRPGYARIGEEI